ncbi:MAG: SUMF1/EgtB/PvdO family nonheme iron enzyme, partial [Treponema sp.]|jgi:hypothetical protein|nr:SUMF1/EgtB/PvdO family nonheme iron enzyme [Treponema sp.]
VAYFKGLENQNKIPRTDKLAPVSQCVYLESNGTPLRDSFNRSFQIPSNFINPSRKGFRLPSSPEWEAAALAQDIANISEADIGWFEKPEGTQKIGQKPVLTASADDTVYDMIGNVWEFCNDTTGNSSRVRRGGAYDSPRNWCIPINNNSDSIRNVPVWGGEEGANGFRIVITK